MGKGGIFYKRNSFRFFETKRGINVLKFHSFLYNFLKRQDQDKGPDVVGQVWLVTCRPLLASLDLGVLKVFMRPDKM